jgi:hypothetical protein
MALLGATAYNMDARQKQVSGNNELEISPAVVDDAVAAFLCDYLHSVLN